LNKVVQANAWAGSKQHGYSLPPSGVVPRY
jgi:hypothetical protein